MAAKRNRFCILIISGMTSLLSLQATAQSFLTGSRLALPKPFYKAAIQKISFDEDGFLWFVTYQGLWRYDGTSVQPFGLDSYGINFTIARTEFTCYDHYLVLVQGYFIYVIDPVRHTIQSFKTRSSQGSLSEDAAGRLFFLNREGEAITWSRKEGFRRVYRFLEKQSPAPNGFESYYFDTIYHKLYVFGGASMGVVEDHSVRWRPVGFQSKSDTLVSPMDMLATKSLLLLRYNNGFAIFNRKTMDLVREYHGFGVSTMLTDNDRLVFFRQTADIPPPIAEDPLYDLKNPLANEPLRKRAVQPVPGHPGNYLMATDKGVFTWTNRDQPDNSPQLVTALAAMKGKSIRAIFHAANGKYYVGTYDGLFVADSFGCRKISTIITYVLRAAGGPYLIGGSEGGSGFLIINTNSDSIGYLPPTPNNVYVYCMMPWRNGFLCGSGNNLYYLYGHENIWTFRTWKSDRALGVVRDLCSWKGKYYLATSTGAWTCDDQGRAKKIFPANGSSMINALLPTPRRLWLATQGKGLVLVDSSGMLVKQVGGQEGLPGLNVYSLSRSGSWIVGGTDGGILMMDENGALRAIPAESPGDDLMAGQEFNHGALWNDQGRNEILAGGTMGLYRVRLPATQGPDDLRRLHLSYIKKGSNTKLSAPADLFAGRKPALIMEPSDTYLSIKIATPVGAVPEALFFRLSGQSEEWQPLNADQEIRLFGLSAGHYTLQVRYGNQSRPSQWLEQLIIVEPSWYNTWWFRLVLLASLAAVGYAIWREKLGKIRREQQLRTAIASDLHDEIGSALTRISISSELLTLRPKQDNEEALHRISTDSKKAIASISDIIWSIDARNDNSADLVMRMREHAKHLLDPSFFDVSIRVEGFDDQKLLPQAMRQNFYLMFKEAVNNIARHGKSGIVEIRLRKNRDGIVLLLRNELKEAKIEEAVHKGQGLRNIAMRVHRLRGTVESGPVNGFFKVQIELPFT
jgi:signal transduction histidine kinase